MSLSPKTSQASSSSKSDSPFDRFWGTRGKESVSQDAESTQQGALVGSSKRTLYVYLLDGESVMMYTNRERQ